MALSFRQQRILEILRDNPKISISAIKDILQADVTQVTLNRDLAKLVQDGLIKKSGKGRGIRYRVSAKYFLFAPIDSEVYFNKEIDSREGEKQFNTEIFSLLADSDLFTPSEEDSLKKSQEKYLQNINNISPTIYKKELERLTIDLSWKSSQMEGNTYSLLETEQLLVQKIEAKNKSKEEAIMVLNHKEALRYIAHKPKQLIHPLRISTIEDIHSVLIRDLNVEKNIRSRLVGITGTTYSPPDNEFQIREYLQKMCDFVNSVEDGFVKAFISIVLISYIQPFADGNKRTARIIGNALLMGSNNCPLSYRSIDPLDYKKAMLLFYEQNSLFMFKDLFIDQYDFAVNNYFLASS
ncbi:MAG: Fic family protein [Bacteroidales bacterium]|nr:Fic family protein [Bacteroidales bacterium]